MVLVDANVIIRIAVKEPKEQYEKVVEFFEKVKNRQIEVKLCSEVAMEVFFVLLKVYGRERSEILELLTTLLAFENVHCDQELVEALVVMKQKNIDFVDALLCARTKIYDYEFFSFDAKVTQCTKQ